MRRSFLLCCSCLYLNSLGYAADERRPNVVILLADDLGSKDIGCYGGPVKTPVLDELATNRSEWRTERQQGIEFSGRCAFARDLLLAGWYSRRAN